MKIGILGAAEIAFRRFLPALKKCTGMEYAGLASRSPEKAGRFVEAFGGQAYTSYDDLLADDTIDSVYIPLPPALHAVWGKKALLAGKHVLMEKPFTTSLRETEELLHLAAERDLAVYENYMFLYHSQLAAIRERIADGEVGEIRMHRAAFGFPKRVGSDFRYNKSLGGGALLDCGGYPIRLAWELLGETADVTQARLVRPEGYEVDLYGSAVLENHAGLCAQVSFGMDNAYQCQLEVWGSKATLTAPRIFTAPDGFSPVIQIHSASGEEHIILPPNDSFEKSIRMFCRSVASTADRTSERMKILRQSRLTEAIKEKGWK